MPGFALPELSSETLGKLDLAGLTIALLGAIESLLSARVADATIDDRHDPNQELIAQGIANLAAPLFGGFAATGAIARTATNVRTGGRSRSPASSMPWCCWRWCWCSRPSPAIPLATLSAIVVVVAINMGEWHEFREPRTLWDRLPHDHAHHLFHHGLLRPVLAVEPGMVLASPVLHLPDVEPDPHRTRLPLTELSMLPGFLYPDGSPRWWPTPSTAPCSSAPSTNWKPCSTRQRRTRKW